MYQKIFIATFSHRANGKRTAVNGMIEPLLSYLLPKTKIITLLDGSHPGSSTTDTFIEEYKNKQLKKIYISFTSSIMRPILASQNTNKTQVIFKIRDLLTPIEVGFRTNKTYDLFIGLESIYTIGGLLLRSVGRVKKVVYYVSDYSPNRYKQKWFNTLYVFLDKYCAQHADYIWNVSPAMQDGRILAGLDPKKSAPAIHVPNALFSHQLIHKPLNKRVPYSLVYAGTLGPENGPDLAIKALAILKKKYPKIKLHIFGGSGTTSHYLEKLAKKLRVESSVIFHGFISDTQKISEAISNYLIGLAPYRMQKDSVRVYGDATKLRLYMGSGIPIITTPVPPLGKEVAKKGAAVIVSDNEKDLSYAIQNLFADKKAYASLKENATRYAKQNTWENTYKTAFSCMKPDVS